MISAAEDSLPVRGTKIQLSPLYFLPIVIVSLRFQTPGGLAVAGASAILATWPSPVAMRQVEEPLAFVTNALTEGLGFSFVALVAGALQRQGQQRRQQRRVLEMTQRDLTMFYGRLDLASGEQRYASAGHDPPLLCRGERVEELPPTGPALGLGVELPPRAGRATLRPGETLLLYTDGLTTARHPMGGRVGEERVAAWLQLGAALPPAELVAELLRLACAAGPAPLEDDVAVIALRRRG